MLHPNNCFDKCYSGDLLDVVLWSERAAAFPVDKVHKDGQTSPQIVIFVGTLVKSFGKLSLNGGSSCKWYINPDVPEVKKLMARLYFVQELASYISGALLVFLWIFLYNIS